MYLPIRIVGILREAKRCCGSATMFSDPQSSNEHRKGESWRGAIIITHHPLNLLDRIAMAEMRSMVESTKGTATGVSAWAYQHFVGEVAVRARVSAFVPEYSLGPEHSFPAAVGDAR
jgi:hypothetical protein